MGTYKFEGNDPNRQRVERDPGEVKEMLLGGGLGDAETEGLLQGSYGRGRTISETLEGQQGGAGRQTKWRDVDGVRFVEIAHTNDVYRITLRCQGCGRASDCVCLNCRHCVAGRPRRGSAPSP